MQESMSLNYMAAARRAAPVRCVRDVSKFEMLDVSTFEMRERAFFIDNLLVRNRFIIVMIRWTGFAPWEF